MKPRYWFGAMAVGTLIWGVVIVSAFKAYGEVIASREVVWVIKPRAEIERDLEIFERLGALKRKPGDSCYIMTGPLIDPPRIVTPPLDDPSFGACAEHEARHLFGMEHD